MNPPESNFRGTLLRHLTALVIIWSLLIFLGLALLAPFTEYLSDSAEGIIVGGFVSVITIVVNSLFQSEATKQAARAAQDATHAGAQAAMTTTPTPQAPLPVEITEPVAVAPVGEVPGSVPPNEENDT